MKQILRKNLTLLLVLGLLVSLVGVPVFAAGLNLTYELGVIESYRTSNRTGALLSYEMKTIQTYGEYNLFHAKPGGSVQVGFLIKNNANIDYRLYSMQNEIEYESSFFESVTVTVSNIGAPQITQRISGQDYIKVAAYGLGNMQSELLSCILTFKVRDDVGSDSDSIIRCTNVIGEEENGDATAITTRDLILYTGETYRPSHTVRFNVSPLADMGETASVLRVRDGTSITLPNPTLDGYVFSGWSDDADSYDGGTSYSVTNDVEFNANWKKLPIITYRLNGGIYQGSSEDFSVTCTSLEEPVTLPIPEREDYTFEGWIDELAETVYKNTLTVTEDMTFTAQWSPATVTVRFDPNGGTMDGESSRTVNKGSAIILPSATREGFNLKYWYAAPNRYNAGASYTATENVTLTAIWRSSETRTTYTDNGNGTHTWTTVYTEDNAVVDTDSDDHTLAVVPLAEGHYYFCTANCGHKTEIEAHTYGSDETCTVCGYNSGTGKSNLAGSVISGGNNITGNGNGDGSPIVVIAPEDVPLAGGAIVTSLGDPTSTFSVSGSYDANGNITVAVTDASGNAVGQVTQGVSVSVFGVTGGQVVAILDAETNEVKEYVKKSLVDDGVAYVLLDGSASIKIVDNAGTFDDVKKTDWFKGAVDFASSHELFNGVTTTEFAPNSPMTRGMLVTVLWRLENKPEDFAANNFPDVANDTWYTEAVEWASKNGIVTGYDDGTFQPNRNITRQEMAAMLYRYMNYLGYDMSARGDLSRFADADQVSVWAEENMRWANGAGIITGKDGNRIDPLGNATRAEVATMLMRIVSNMVK